MGAARDKLLKAAGQRFYADGITATGIDRVIAEAGVAKMSLYNNFSSKQELVVAYLHERHAEWLRLLERRLAETTRPRDRVLAVFDAYLDHAAFVYERGFRGCGLLNGAAELPAGHPGREAVREHKEEVQRIFVRLLAEAGIADADALGEHLFLLVEGATVNAGLDGGPRRLQRSRALAEGLLDAA